MAQLWLPGVAPPELPPPVKSTRRKKRQRTRLGAQARTQRREVLTEGEWIELAEAHAARLEIAADGGEGSIAPISELEAIAREALLEVLCRRALQLTAARPSLLEKTEVPSAVAE